MNMKDDFGLFPCDPAKNVGCPKGMCYMLGGPCHQTTNADYAVDADKMSELGCMMKMQADFQRRLDKNFFDKTIQERVAFIKEHSIHLNQEINEMLYELPFFKPWKDYSDMDEEAQLAAMAKARMECIDAWHFFMNIMIALGFTADEFVYMYLQKNKENHRRQDEGYTADKSYRNQSVEEVMGHE